MTKRKLPQVLAVSLIQDARSYVECVPVLNKHLHGRGKLFDPKQHQLGPPHKVPMYFLLGHSIELALKAHLTASGVPEKTLSSKELRHNIDELFGMAHDYRFVPADDRFPKLLDWLAPYQALTGRPVRKFAGSLQPDCKRAPASSHKSSRGSSAPYHRYAGRIGFTG